MKKILFFTIIAITFFSFVPVFGYSQSLSDNDFQLISQRISQSIKCNRCNQSDKKHLDDILSIPVGKGWRDNDYPSERMRIADILRYVACGCDYGENVRSRLREAYNYSEVTKRNDYGQWWQMYYNLPILYGSVLLKFKFNNRLNVVKSKDNDIISYMENYLDRYGFSVKHDKGGSNTMWPVLGGIYKAIYFHDKNLLKRAVDYAKYVPRQTISIDEGAARYANIQKDWSFFEHGEKKNINYFTFASSAFIKMAYWLDGTSIAINKFVPDEDINKRNALEMALDFFHYYLKWIALGDRFVPYTTSRKYEWASNLSAHIRDGVRLILKTSYPEVKEHKAELTDFLNNKKPIGTVAFPLANLLVIRRPHFDGAIDMMNFVMPFNEDNSYSSLFGNFFFINGSNDNILDSSNVINYPRGILNALTLPVKYFGTKYSGIETPGREEWKPMNGLNKMIYGNWPYTGQTTLDNYYGLAAEALNNGDFGMKKSWFVFDNEIVSIGSGIFNDNTDNSEVNTYLDTFKKSDSNIKIHTSNGDISRDADSLNNVKWLAHNNYGIIFPNPIDLKVDNYINDYKDDYKTIYINHGKIVRDKNYVAIYLPYASVNKIRDYSKNPDVEIARMDNRAHIVREKRANVVGAAFFQAADSNLLSSNLPAYILYKQKNNKLSFSLHNPNKEPEAVRKISGWPYATNPKIDYAVPLKKATCYSYQITMPYNLQNNKYTFFSVKNIGNHSIISISMRPYRTFFFSAQKEGNSYIIDNAFVSFNELDNENKYTAISVCGNSGNRPPINNNEDINRDGKTDIQDLGILLSNWGKTDRGRYDINQDGKTGNKDIELILTKF